MCMASQRAAFGMHAFFGKNDVSIEDKFRTVEVLTQYALRTVPKLVAKAAGNRVAQCMKILFAMAFEDYARSAGSVCRCQNCNGKGQLTHRCRCKGRGKVYDEEQSELQGAPVFKDCPKCSGRGYKRVPSSVAYQAIKHLVPDLTQPTWSRNWKPFYEGLIDKCYLEESTAEAVFFRISS